ncbi:MAG: TolC family protein [Proteobacteria bacterium]|nr:TolC family protein [Pseudomonadota bacterium]
MSKTIMWRGLSLMAVMLTSQICAADTSRDLREALDKAWARNAEASTLEARRAEITAQRTAASSLFPGAPALEFSDRSDRYTDNRGQDELEAGVSVPLWLPGQQAARAEEVNAAEANLNQAMQALRLKLAGELREAIWAVTLAASQVVVAEQHLETAKKLEADVRRRVAAGDLAQTDLNLAQNGTLIVQAALLEAQTRLFQAGQSYSILVGAPPVVAGQEEALLPPATLDEHPRLTAARSAIAYAQAQLHVANAARRDSPELTLSTRRERRDDSESYDQSIGIALRLPFATEARNRPLTASAETALTQTQAQYEQARRQLEVEIKQAEQGFQAAQQALAISATQQRLMAENAVLLQKSFDLGELSLVLLLQAKNAAFSAEQAYTQQKIALALGKARLNQAQGILP